MMRSLAATAVGASRPVAEWTFDEGRGKAAHDASGNRHEATLHGATWAKHGGGYALMMDGHDDYVECGDSGEYSGQSYVWEIAFQPKTRAHIGPSLRKHGIS